MLLRFFCAVEAIVMPMAAALAVPAPNSGPSANDRLAGYRIEELKWRVPARPGGGEYHNVTGTVEEVIAEIDAIEPGFSKRAADFGKGKNFNVDLETLINVTEWKTDSLDCYRYPAANADRIYQGVMYLAHVGGVPEAGAGPNLCGRVSCSWDSAIYWCNDNPDPFRLNTFRDIAMSAYFILRHCEANSGVYTSG